MDLQNDLLLATLKGLRSDIAGLRDSLDAMHGEARAVRGEAAALAGRVARIEARLDALESKQHGHKWHVGAFKLLTGGVADVARAALLEK